MLFNGQRPFGRRRPGGWGPAGIHPSRGGSPTHPPPPPGGVR